MEKKDFQEAYNKGYSAGYLQAAQEVASTILRLIDNHPSWILPGDRAAVAAEIKMATRHRLQRKGLVPSTYEIMRGRAEDVPLDFNMQ